VSTARSSGQRAAALVLVASFAGSLVEIVAGPVLSRYSPYQVVWSRYAIHLLVVMLWTGRSAPWRTRRPGRHLLASACMLAMPHYFVVGSRSVPAENVWAFFWISPLLALAIGWLALGERPALPAWLTAAACFPASLLIFGDLPVPPASDLLPPLAMALSFAVYIVVVRSLREESMATKLFYTAAGVFIALSPAMPGLFVLPDLRAVLAQIGIALLGLAFLAFLDRALEGAPVATMSPFLYGGPLFHVVILAVLGVVPGRRWTLATVILVGALLLAYRREGPANQDPTKPDRSRDPTAKRLTPEATGRREG
jgi:drug/metabolite transporter (DMT)-like permease